MSPRDGGLRSAVSAAQMVALASPADADPAVQGRIVVAAFSRVLPFQPQRLYWIHGMALGEERGFHAHRRLWQAMVAMSGRIDIELDDGTAKRLFTLSACTEALVVPPGLWRNIASRSEGSLLLVIASEDYDESDYIRSYDGFLAYRRAADKSH